MIHHLEMYVSDLKKSLSFWDWFLIKMGYEEYQKWNDGKSFKLQNTYLVFVQTKEKYLHIPYHRSRTGLNHLAFHAASRKEVDEFRITLKERGCTILYEDKYPFAGGDKHYALFFEDPDRIKVEIVAELDEKEWSYLRGERT